MVNKLSVFKEYTQKYEKYRKEHDLILGIQQYDKQKIYTKIYSTFKTYYNLQYILKFIL